MKIISFTVRALALTSVFLSFAAGCGEPFHTTEATQDGKVSAWWVHVTIVDGRPSGHQRIYQTDAGGNALASLQSASENENYDGYRDTYTVKLSNRENCTDPCGYIRALICPASDLFCEPAKAIADLGVKRVSGWEVEF